MGKEQAPKILREGRPQVDGNAPFGKLIVDNRIFYAIYKATDRGKSDLGIMMLLLGCAQDGRFKLPFTTVQERLGISSSSTYYDALNRLQDKGLITWIKGDSITIMMDNIWALVADSGEPENSGLADKRSDSGQAENYNEIPVNRKDDSVQTDSESPVYTQYNNIREQDNKQDNDSGLPEKETKGWSQWEDFVF